LDESCLRNLSGMCAQIRDMVPSLARLPARKSHFPLGCTVTEADDGKEALDALEQRKFDAIVTDGRMPRVTGIELVRALHESGSSTPVIIFVSGFVDLTLPDAYDLGVEAVLSKPCPRKELVNAPRRSIQRRNLVFDSDEDVPPPAAG
jgi:CheY-like chemotaxis protein